MIYTQSVEAWAEIDGIDEFKLKSAKVERPTGPESGQAVITGITENPDDIPIAAYTRIYVEASSVDGAPGEPVQIFGGRALSVTVDGKGVTKLKAHDERIYLVEQLIDYTTGNNNLEYPDSVLVNILGDIFGDIARDMSNAGRFTPYVAPRSEFVGGQYPSSWRFESLIGTTAMSAVLDLASALNGRIWVDRHGVLQITPYPAYTEWDVPAITEINVGEEKRNAERIVFKGDGIASKVGDASTYIHSQTSPSSEASIEPSDSSEEQAPKTIMSDDNVISQEEADDRAFSEGVRQDQLRNMGSVTIIGNAEIELYDNVIIPEIENNTGTQFQNFNLIPNTIFKDKEFKVDTITHKINSDDGFLTTLGLTPTVRDSYKRTDVTSVAGFNQKFLAHNSNQVKSKRVSGVDDGTGFLSSITAPEDDDDNS